MHTHECVCVCVYASVCTRLVRSHTADLVSMHIHTLVSEHSLRVVVVVAAVGSRLAV